MITNLQQQSFIESEADNILCLAGAGAGKTHSLLSKISHLEDTLHIDPENILVLTFTNAAARELRFRYKTRFSSSNTISVPKFCTFHAFCYKILCKEPDIYRALKYTSPPKIADEYVMKRLKSSAKLMSGCTLSDDILNSTSCPSKLSECERRDFEIYQKCLSKIMLQDNYITFDALAHNICEMFVNQDERVSKYIGAYTHIFVDEFQDTDPEQWRFVNALRYNQLCVVGDVLQAIYGFRGADSSIIKELSNNPDWTKIKFEKNYRSDKKIVEYANNFTSYADDSYKITMDAESDKDGVAMEYTYQNFNDMNQKILELLHQWKDAGSTAIISYTNKEAYFNAKLLEDHHIEFSASQQTDIFDVQCCIRSVLDPTYFIDVCSSVLSSDQYSSFLQHRFDVDYVDSCIYFLDAALHATHVDYNRYQQIRALVMAAKEAKCTELELINQIKSIYQLDDLSDITTLAKFLDVISSRDQETKKSLIYVGTIHSVKGLEFDNVIVTGVDGKSFKLSSEENQNLFYVAITRAQHQLAVFRYG